MKLKIVWPKATHSIKLEVSHMLPLPVLGASWEFSWYSKTNEETLGPMFHKLSAHVSEVRVKSVLDIDDALDTEVTIFLGEVNNYITTVGSQSTYRITGHTIAT